MKKNILTVLLIGTLMTAMLAGCGKSSAENTAPTAEPTAEADNTEPEQEEPNVIEIVCDRNNLLDIDVLKELDGFFLSSSSWGQVGRELTEDEIALITEGTVLEILFESDSGNMWIVLPECEKGWKRIGVGDADGSGQGYPLYNDARNIAQITYEDICEYCGSDTSKWGKLLQCESDGKYNVYSITIGKVK